MSKPIIIAVDFDCTLYLGPDKFPDAGPPNIPLIKYLIHQREIGNKVILWSCRDIPEHIQKAVDWCKSYGLEFDAVNDNLPETVSAYNVNARKVFADIYIDDRAIECSEFMKSLGGDD